MELIYPSVTLDYASEETLKALERYGRVAHKSEDKITEDSAPGFVEKIIRMGHESVLEHRYITAIFIIDRGVSHELVRHRIASYTQESTRYCNYAGSDMQFIIPPWVKIAPMTISTDVAFMDVTNSLGFSEGLWLDNMYWAEKAYNGLLEGGWAPEQARSVLPNSLKTEIVVTANIREWRHMFRLRLDKAAHPQMREAMGMLYDLVSVKFPVLFPPDPKKL